MTGILTLKTLLRSAFASGLALLLTGCMLMPGKFVAELVLMRDGTFTYSYDGEIHFLSMNKLMQMGSELEQGEFTPDQCYNSDTFEDRECTAEELAQQRGEYDERMAAKKQNDALEAERMKQVFGGIDPADPASGDELARRIERQTGFDKVRHKGDGAFEVSYRISGRLDHDFLFPTFERLPMGNYFLLAGRRDDGTVRIDAPGFASQNGVNPMSALMSGMDPGFSARPQQDMPGMPVLDGTFAIITDGEILTNNTDEGPSADPRGRKLSWRIDRSTANAPTALIRIGN